MSTAAQALEMLSFHRFLLGETNVRLERLRQAIVARVKPGDTVLDLGTGTGILAFFACLAGARRVFAVETGPVIELARILARENRFADRVVFLDGASEDIDLPERVDAVVTDTFGLWQPDAFRSVIDARDRLLKPDGALIPSSVEFFVSPADVAEAYQRHVDFWNHARNGVDLSGIRQFAVNHCYPVNVEPHALLAKPASLGLVLLSKAADVVLRANVSLIADKPGTLHGLCGWLTSDLTDRIELTNRPGATSTNYAQGFFPVAQPTAIIQGDRINVSITSHDSLYWRWQVEIERRHDGVIETVAKFDHSTLLGLPLSAASLRDLKPDRVPTLSQRGKAELYLLGMLDGKASIAELRKQVGLRYSDLFKSPEEVSAFVADVLARSA